MEDTIIADVRLALADRGLSCRSIALVSPPGAGRRAGRYTLRVDLEDGSIVKVRRLESPEEAARLVAVRKDAPRAFAPVIEQRGALLFEAWIPGSELPARDAAARAEELGALLGSLHAIGSPGAHHASTQAHLDRAIEQLGMLAEGDVISRGVRESLEEELRRIDPGDSLQTLVHLDFCPPNIVVDAAGALHVVDNEWMRVEAPGLDLGRTYTRWATDEVVWGRFMRGYATTSRVDPEPLRFWMIAMAARSAVIRLQGPVETRALPVARLHELAAQPQG